MTGAVVFLLFLAAGLAFVFLPPWEYWDPD